MQWGNKNIVQFERFVGKLDNEMFMQKVTGMIKMDRVIAFGRNVRCRMVVEQNLKEFAKGTQQRVASKWREGSEKSALFASRTRKNVFGIAAWRKVSVVCLDRDVDSSRSMNKRPSMIDQGKRTGGDSTSRRRIEAILKKKTLQSKI